MKETLRVMGKKEKNRERVLGEKTMILGEGETFQLVDTLCLSVLPA